MIKRSFDLSVAAGALLLASPVLLCALVAVWLQDARSPLYFARRAARGGGEFRMVKIRSMIADAERTGVSSTAADDPRVTPVGRFVRACKLDELPQLWNVLAGDMSLVGPRPQVQAATESYSREEARLLTVRPGITDPASIVFSDEGEILRGSADPDLLYSQIVRPWKNRLALLYLDHMSLGADLALVCLTALSMVSKRAALNRLAPLLKRWGANEKLLEAASRRTSLEPYPPPGAERAAAAFQ